MPSERPPFNLFRFQLQAFPVLLGWAVGSMVAGWFWWRSGNAWLRGLGSQFLGWGLIDGLIAAFGLRQAGKSHHRFRSGELTPADHDRQRRNFEKIIAFNSFLDVGYILGGAWFLRKSAGQSLRQGIAWGIILQGGFLLIWDILLFIVTLVKQDAR